MTIGVVAAIGAAIALGVVYGGIDYTDRARGTCAGQSCLLLDLSASGK